MRIIKAQIVSETVAELFIKANIFLPDSLEKLIYSAGCCESCALAKSILGTLGDNIKAAQELDIPICQDTGMAVVLAEIGDEVFVDGNFTDAINEGVRTAYRDGYLRCSVVDDPLFNRKNTKDNTPAVIHIRYTHGDRIRLTAAPKGFGSENKSAVHMFTPGAGREDIIGFVTETVMKAGADPCPPVVVGVGIGGTFEMAAILAKYALCRDVDVRNANEEYAALERDMLRAVNSLGIGPQGFGGDTTALAVNIEYYPTHIAGLPVAVNMGCHVTRHAESII